MDEQGTQAPQLNQEELLGLLKTRGFSKGFQRTPLRDFFGRLDSITGNLVTRFQPPRLEVLFNFSEVDVVESTEPYQMPVAQLGIFNSNAEKSAMGYWGTSIDKIVNPKDANGTDINPPEQIKGQSALIGKLLHLKLTDGHLIYDGTANKEIPKECWEVLEVEGFETVVINTIHTPGPTAATPQAPATGVAAKAQSSNQRALEMLEGKNEQDFYQAVFQDPIVKADTGLVNSILQRTYLSPLVDAGIIMKDANGIYHKIPTAE